MKYIEFQDEKYRGGGGWKMKKNAKPGDLTLKNILTVNVEDMCAVY